MISIDHLTVEFGAKPLFSDVSFVVNDHDRIALVGKNGAGKSTMLKLLCGIQEAYKRQHLCSHRLHYWLSAAGDEDC